MTAIAIRRTAAIAALVAIVLCCTALGMLWKAALTRPVLGSPRAAIELPEHGHQVSLAWLGDHRIVVGSAKSPKLLVFDLPMGDAAPREIEVEGCAIGRFVTTPDGRFLAAEVSSDPHPGRPVKVGATVRVWNDSLEEVAAFPIAGPFRCRAGTHLDISPEGDAVVFSNMDNLVEIWDVAAGEKLKDAPFNQTGLDDFRGFEFSRSGDAIAALARNDLLYWSWRDANAFARVASGRGNLSLAISPDDLLLATGPDSRNSVELRDLKTLALKRSPPLTLPGRRASRGVDRIAFAANGEKLIGIGSFDAEGDLPEVDVLFVWDVAAGTVSRQIELDDWNVAAFSISPDETSLAMVVRSRATGKHEARVWDVSKLLSNDSILPK